MNKKANKTSFKKGNPPWNKGTKGVMKPNRTSFEKGITLSKKSHKEFHHIYGNKNNTKEQLLKFLSK